MQPVQAGPEPVPRIANEHHYRADRKACLAHELICCRVLLEQLKRAPAPHTASLKSRITLLTQHVGQLEEKLEKFPLVLREDEIAPTLRRIERLKKMHFDPECTPPKLQEIIGTFPPRLRFFIDGEVYRLHPGRKAEQDWGKRMLDADPELLFSLQTNQEALIDRVERLARRQIPSPVDISLYTFFGSHIDGQTTTFRVFAPHAKSVYLKFVENGKPSQQSIKMERLHFSGAWQVQVKDVREGQAYEYSIEGRDGVWRSKLDPFAIETMQRPGNAHRLDSVVSKRDGFAWEDAEWLQEYAANTPTPNILELHLEKWRTNPDGSPLTYSEIAEQLIAYCKQQNYTHVQLMKMMADPNPRSMGYQVVGFFAPNPAHGTLTDFKAFINALHKAGIGVYVDLCVAYFPREGYGLSNFDGTPLFERIQPLHEDPDKHIHQKWRTNLFKLESDWVRNFVSSAAYYLIQELHLQGIRFDAVPCTLWKNGGHEDGHFLPNIDGTDRDYFGERLYREMNQAIHAKVPGALLMAENWKDEPKIKVSADQGGMEFNLTWNFSRQFDFLRYFAQPFDQRQDTWRIRNAIQRDQGTSALTISSHDEFAHDKGSLPDKMPGDIAQKFAGARLYHSVLYCAPGRGVMTCMGTEFAQPHEWVRGLSGDHPAVEWEVLDDARHKGVQRFTADLGALYTTEPSLYSAEKAPVIGFDNTDKVNCVVRYVRHAKDGKRLLFVHNFSPTLHKGYGIPVKDAPVKTAKEILNSDAEIYAGGNTRNEAIAIKDRKELLLDIPPLSTIILELQ